VAANGCFGGGPAKEDFMRATGLIISALLVAACRPQEPSQSNVGGTEPSEPAKAAKLRWDLQSSGEGVALALVAEPGNTAMRLFCPAAKNQLVVNVPAFKSIASEERLSFGSGGEVVALVADPAGDPQRGGVTGDGGVPANLAALVSGQVSASYGAQSSGPHPAPPGELARAFVRACAKETVKPAPQPAGACLTQDGNPVPANRVRALGTEPFWGAKIEGRCVTYSHPEDQAGTRVWTKFGGTTSSGSWTGSLGGHPFVLRTRPEAGCSDGMSDRRYPIAVNLTVGGEQRRGCAEPL
jgi:uncharacterized membrane protein